MANTMSAYGSNTNRPLSEIVGLSTDTKPTDSIEGIKIQNGSSFRELDTGKRFLFDAENITWNEVSSGGGGGGGSTLIEKSISANGVYNASLDSADGYSKVTVDVSNTYSAQDEGKVVDNGALVAQTAMSSEVTENGTVDTTLYNSVTVNVPSGGGDYNVKTINVQGQPFGLIHNTIEVNIPNGVTSIEGDAFKSCSRLTKITFPETVTSIGSSAFRGCSSLTELTIPNITTISNYLIYQCISLTSFTIPETVTSIGMSAFRGCVGITNFEIPSGVTSIDGDAFRDCTGLQSIKFKSTTPPTIGGVSTFNGVPTTCIIYVPTGTIETYKAAQYYPNPSTYTYEEY